MSKRKTATNDNMAPTTPKKNNVIANEFNISLAQPLKDYKQLIDSRVQVDEIVDDFVTKENFEKTAAAARDVIWRLLFEASASESHHKAAELLEEYKGDASFYAPWPYNEWIIKLRDELLKRELLDFWRDVVVKKQLGPCWSRDSDLFDSDDTPPLEFYAQAGCVAPFAASLKVRAAAAAEPRDATADAAASAEAAGDVDAVLTSNFEAVIGKEQPLHDYRNLMKRYVLTDLIVPDAVHKKSIQKIAKAARETVWSLLFDNDAPAQADLDKAAELLLEYKGDACFYAPWPYNEWIVELRDELLSRELLDFWREKMVKEELGPCWARESDLFDHDDPAPLEFYERAGCKAPFEAPEQD